MRWGRDNWVDRVLTREERDTMVMHFEDAGSQGGH